MWYIVAGFLFGAIGGMGLGGGIVLIPALTLLLGMSQHGAQGANLAAFMPMCVCALICHFKNKMIDVSISIKMGIFGAIGAAGGAYLAYCIDENVLKKLFGFFLIFLSVSRCVKRLKNTKNK